jgi:hypothetical protein
MLAAAVGDGVRAEHGERPAGLPPGDGKTSDAAPATTKAAGTRWRTEANPLRFCATRILYSPYWKYCRQKRRSDGVLK